MHRDEPAILGSELGLEPTPGEYIEQLVGVLAEVWRVLKPDGVVWLNLGDSYCNFDKWGGGKSNTGKHTIADDGSVPSFAVRCWRDGRTSSWTSFYDGRGGFSRRGWWGCLRNGAHAVRLPVHAYRKATARVRALLEELEGKYGPGERA